MFIPRHPVIENQFCQYKASSETSGIGGVVCYAGSVVYLDPTNPESIVNKVYHECGQEPFGLSMQKVKTGYHSVHPAGYSMPGDLGSSDVIAQPSYNTDGAINGTKAVPVGVAHLGIWDTVHYTCIMTDSVIGTDDEMTPGDKLYPAADEAKLTNNTSPSAGVSDAADKATGAAAKDSVVVSAKVLKGASKAKCQANFNNTTLYPIRVKLLV